MSLDSDASLHELIVTVTARDQVGIISCITRTILTLGGTVDELSQTVMRGYFIIILAARFPRAVTPEQLETAIQEDGKELGLVANVRASAEDISSRPENLADRYILTVQGGDRPGIIAQISTYLASQGINIEDFYARAEPSGFIMVLQIQVAGSWDADQLRLDVEAIGNEIGLKAYLQHEDIFRATSEVAAVRRLVTHRRAAIHSNG